MRSLFKPAFFSFLFLFTFSFYRSGFSESKKSEKETPLLAPSHPIEQSVAFKRALKITPDRPEFQKARIDYLLERVSKSPYNFWRNGSQHTGKRAAAHLRWKMIRRYDQVKTAEDFIERVATRSKISGEPYLVLFPGGKRPLGGVLHHELELFDQVIQKQRSTT